MVKQEDMFNLNAICICRRCCRASSDMRSDICGLRGMYKISGITFPLNDFRSIAGSVFSSRKKPISVVMLLCLLHKTSPQ